MKKEHKSGYEKGYVEGFGRGIKGKEIFTLLKSEFLLDKSENYKEGYRTGCTEGYNLAKEEMKDKYF